MEDLFEENFKDNFVQSKKLDESVVSKPQKTHLRECLETRTIFNKRGPFLGARNIKKFRPDWSFHEEEHKRESYLLDHPEEIVSLESQIGQNRFMFVMRNVKEEYKRKNYELVELVVISLLRCTNCDAAKTLHRAHEYFDFYEDLFGCLSYEQSLEDDELRESLETGAIELFENADDEGRALTSGKVSEMMPAGADKAEKLLKMMNYMIIRTLRNYPTAQKNGFIFMCNMGDSKFENLSSIVTRTHTFSMSRYMPVKISKILLFRPIYFVKFCLTHLKSVLVRGAMSERFYILTENAQDLFGKPVALREDILPPIYGGKNWAYDLQNRLRGWRLEEQENEISMGSSYRAGDEDMMCSDSESAQNSGFSISTRDISMR